MHDGGVAGSDVTFRRSVAPEWFTNAMRYHGGGIAGLRPDEVPAILQRGEEVLTASDARHRANGGAGAAPVNVRNVNLFDPADMLEKALVTRRGERVVLNIVQNNPGAFKAALGG
jgi:hypothetical protein